MSAQRLRRHQGSVLATAAISAGVLSLLVAGFLTYLGNEYYLNGRSHRWTQGLHLAEAGIEIGFAELNYRYMQGGNGFQTSRGWANPAAGTYVRTITGLTNSTGQVVGSVTVTVSGVGGLTPQIDATSVCANTPRG